jgi:hypothetical protein
MADIPHLKAKLRILYNHHKTVNTHAELARQLGIAVANISIWIQGIGDDLSLKSENSPSDKVKKDFIRLREQVPDKHVLSICEIFSITRDVLLLADLSEFKAVIEGGSWRRFVGQAEPWEALRLIPKEGSKGLVFPDDNSNSLEAFSRSQLVSLSLALPKPWADRAEKEPVYLALFSVDAEHTSSLVPSRAIENVNITEPEYSIPTLQIQGPCGKQSIIVLLTTQEFDGALLNSLKNSERILDALNRLVAKADQWKKQDWLLLKKEYEVI